MPSSADQNDQVGYYGRLGRQVARAITDDSHDTPPEKAPSAQRTLLVRQRPTRQEIYFESRNRYDIIWSDGKLFGYAEEAGGMSNFIMRQLFRYSIRSFKVHFYTPDDRHFLTTTFSDKFWVLRHRMEARDHKNRLLGTLLGSPLRMVLSDHRGEQILYHRLRGWRLFYRKSPSFEWRCSNGAIWARVHRTLERSRGLMKDNNDIFELSFDKESKLKNHHKTLILASAIFIDIRYFDERPFLKRRYRRNYTSYS